MQKVIFFTIRCLSVLIPKSSKRIIFISKPDFSDNTKIFYDYIKKNSNKELVWLCFDSRVATTLSIKFGIKAFVIKSFKGIKLYLTTKYIVTSSGSLWQFKSKTQKQFDLWHGILLKNLLNLEPGTKKQKFGNTVDARFATSTITQAFISASFNCFPQDVYVTGHPRTDALFERGNLEKIILDKSSFKKIVLYMPTYRKGYKTKNDGREFDASNIFNFEVFDKVAFEAFLQKENVLFLVKLHPYEEKIFKEAFQSSRNIRFVSHKDMYENNLDTYQILGELDMLLTDYSSVYLDFLLTRKPLVFIPTDLEQYTQARGFMLEPYEDVTPGAKVFTQKELEHSLLMEDQYQEEREKLLRITHRYHDAHSGERIAEVLKTMM